ncbi:protein ANTI-SILENCING 1-like isoform X3 [Senna tora]|uniref:Protein ANTI-SILENCING 1-like isoform X3 n=1 Tax=Senna tora TaxID=362788 RepID=A0A834WAL4_9FABA|nr:protein ANTI-SILENCING 1-like isoform X3 [Senna tora]
MELGNWLKAVVVGYRMHSDQRTKEEGRSNQKQGRRWGEPKATSKTNALINLMEKLRMEDPVKEKVGEVETGVGEGVITPHRKELDKGEISVNRVQVEEGADFALNCVGQGVVDSPVVTEKEANNLHVLTEIQNVAARVDKENIDPLTIKKSLRKYKKEARTATVDSKGSMGVEVLSKRKRGDVVGVEVDRLAEESVKKLRGWVEGGRVVTNGEETTEIDISAGPGEIRVCDLLDDSGEWRDEILNFLFQPDICNRIKSIGATDVGKADRWNWLGDAKGGFTVKQCYLHAMRDKWQGIDLLPNLQGSVHSDFWRRMWKLPVLPKHKNFLWRACVGILPTCVALKNRGVELETACTFCGLEEEELYHVLVECPRISDIWRGSRFNYDSRRWHNNIVEWLAVEGSTWSQDQLGMCVLALYLLWEARNAKRFSDTSLAIARFWCRAAAVWDEIKDSKAWQEWNASFGLNVGWEKPRRGWVKMNTDAGCLPEGGGVIGGLIRDGEGVCLAAFTEKRAGMSNPMVLEAEAVRRGMEVALQLGLDRVIFETDAKMVTEQLISMDIPSSPLLGICRQIHVLKNAFVDVRFTWVPRCCNKVSHFLVSFAKDYIQDNLWLDQLPSFLSDAIVEDETYFKWGNKSEVGVKNKDVQFYESFTYKGVEYFLYDCVYFYQEGDFETSIGKLVRIFETPTHKKKVQVVWLFRPVELRNYLGDYQPHSE